MTALKHWENSGKLRTLYRMKWDSCDLILGCLCWFLNLHCSTLTSRYLPKDKNMINMNLDFLGSLHQSLHPGCDTQRLGTLKCIEYLPQCVPKGPLTSVWMWLMGGSLVSLSQCPPLTYRHFIHQAINLDSWMTLTDILFPLNRSGWWEEENRRI